jgi:hypothetical protein
MMAAGGASSSVETGATASGVDRHLATLNRLRITWDGILGRPSKPFRVIRRAPAAAERDLHFPTLIDRHYSAPIDKSEHRRNEGLGRLAGEPSVPPYGSCRAFARDVIAKPPSDLELLGVEVGDGPKLCVGRGLWLL